MVTNEVVQLELESLPPLRGINLGLDNVPTDEVAQLNPVVKSSTRQPRCASAGRREKKPERTLSTGTSPP